MNWIALEEEAQLTTISERSFDRPQVIFKHSTRCGVSSAAKTRLERSELPGQVDFHYLNIISFRSVSNAIANIFKVPHESPQVLVIVNGNCVYHESHGQINMQRIVENATKKSPDKAEDSII